MYSDRLAVSLPLFPRLFWAIMMPLIINKKPFLSAAARMESRALEDNRMQVWKEDMYMTRQINLSVDDTPIEMDYFVQSFIDHTVFGMVSSLEGIYDISDIEIKINGNDATISVNNNSLPLKDFVAAIISSTVRGMVSSLKGVEKAETIQIGIQR